MPMLAKNVRQFKSMLSISRVLPDEMIRVTQELATPGRNLLVNYHPQSGWLAFSATGRNGKSTSVLSPLNLYPGAKHPVCFARINRHRAPYSGCGVLLTQIEFHIV